MPPSEQQTVQRFLFHSELLDTFSVSASFREAARHQILPYLLLPSATVRDGFLACAISWAQEEEEEDDDSGSPQRLHTSCYRYASSAKATLVSLRVTDVRTMDECLTLGALLSTYALRLRLNDVLAICGWTLGLIRPIYYETGGAGGGSGVGEPESPGTRVFLSCMVMWELRACLFSCAEPQLRFRPPTGPYVDRSVGLCATLLPILHDVCRVSHRMAAAGTDNDSVLLLLDELDVLNRSVQEWQAEVPDDFTTRFDAVEVSHMLCQAQVLRLAVQLVIHRLRCPFGKEDAAARILSLAILTQLELVVAATSRQVRCVDLALLVACLELRGVTDRQKWLARMPWYAISKEFGEHARGTVLSLWAAMDLHGSISWADLMALGSPFLREA